MGDETTKRAAQEYLAAKLAEEGQSYEDKLNREAAIALAPRMWKKVTKTVIAKCGEWNEVTKEETFVCKETPLGDLRIRCAGRSPMMTVHYDSRKLVIVIRNMAREKHEKDVILHMEGYPTESGRDVHLIRSNQIVNFDMLFVGELRVLAGLSRQTEG